MKHNRQILLAALLCAAAGSFVACSQDEEVTLHRPSEATEQTVTENPSATRGGDPVVCVVKTDTLGQVQGKVEAFVKEGGTSVLENITDLYIEGPINQTDINYIKNLQYLDSLSLEKALIHDGNGKQTNLLAANSFEGMKSESAVYLPKTVTRLGAKCFMNANIRAIYMEDIKTLETTKEHWYYYKVYYNEADGYPCGTMSDAIVQGRHFDHCTKLKTVKLSKQLVNISTWMFAYCSSLQKIDLASVKEIQTGAFVEAGLEELTMTDYLVTIGLQAFRSCTKLKTITSSNSVKKIDSFAFRGCTALTEFTLPDVKDFGTFTLAQCTNLKNVEWSDKVHTIPGRTFYGCTNLNFEIPNHITVIGEFSLELCTSITHATIPEGVTSIGEGAFQYAGLTSLPKGLNSIPNYCFRGCNGLTEVTIPEGITSIGVAAFGQCSNLVSVQLPENRCTIGAQAFRDCEKLQNLVIPTCGDIGDGAFFNDNSLITVKLPANTGNIGEWVFKECSYLEVVEIGSCSSLAYESFRLCERLKKISIGSVGTIDHHAFDKCTSLKEVKIDKAETINEYAFKNCTSLKELEIGSCQYIGIRAFQYCAKLEKLKMGSIKTIGGWVFEGCTALEDVDIQSVEALQESAFMTCTKLKSIVLPEGLKSIDVNVFGGCSSLTNLTIPSTVNAVTDRGFLGGCTQLQYVRWNSTDADVAWLAAPNPNLLLYVPAGVAVDSRNSNVIVNGKANQIKLQQSEYPFYCPEAFTATEVVFECDYGSNIWKSVATGNGVAARWNAIALPFTVKNIVSDNKGSLAPFGSDAVNNGKAKPFWLCELTADGWKDVLTIEANKPYLVAMPNNPNYLDEYNIQDVVSFKAQNVTIEKTPDELTPSPVGPDGWALTPVYMATGTTTNEFNINWEAFTDRKGEWHPVGNCFRLNIRPSYSFEAVIQPNATTRAEYISLGSKATTRSARPLGKVPQREDMRLW